MAIFKRVRDLLSANLNDLIDKAENPEKMLKEYLLQANTQLAEVRHEVAIAVAAREKVVGSAAETQQEMNSWAERARMAVAQHRDDLAREAISRRQSLEAKFVAYNQQLEGLDSSTHRLEDGLRELERKVREAENQRDMLVSRYHTAHAMARVQEVLGGIGEPSALGGLDKMKDRVLSEEARARAADEVTGSSVDAQFRQLEAGQGEVSVEAELAALKGETAPQLPAGEQNPV